MNPEQPTVPEQNPGVREKTTLPLDASLFDKLEEFKNGITDEKVKGVFTTVVEESKLRAFYYADEMLDYLISPAVFKKEKDEKEDIHQIKSTLQQISVLVEQFCGARLDIYPGNLHQNILGRFEAASLRYAFSKLSMFQKRVNEGKEDSTHIAEEMGFPRSLNPDKLSHDFFGKLQKLDPLVREKLLNESQ